MPRDAPVMTTTFRSGVMFALSHGRVCFRASRYIKGPNAASRRLLNCCHFLLQNWLTELAAATGKRIVFYCAIADRSAMAVQAAQDAGLKTACHIAGRIDAWKKADGPLAAVSVSGPTCFRDRV